MIDRIHFRPWHVFLTDEATKIRSTTDRYDRAHYLKGKVRGGVMVISFGSGRRKFLRVVSCKTKDARWAVNKIEANLPSLVFGHNGRPLRAAADVWLALTILVFLVKQVTERDGHSRIIPGVGAGNLGYISYVECMVQIHDPARSLIYASHTARMSHQQAPNCIYFGQSTRCHTRELQIAFYDKLAESYHGSVDPPDLEPTKAEVRYRDELRLAKDIVKTGCVGKAAGEVVSTLGFDVLYPLVRQAITRITGFGWGADLMSLAAVKNKNARILACGLGDAIYDARRVELALHAFAQSEQLSVNIMHEVERSLRAYAVRATAPNIDSLLPADAADLAWADVNNPFCEQDHARLLEEMGAPTEADPAIAEAWLTTTLLSEKPEEYELIGNVMPAPPAFRVNTL